MMKFILVILSFVGLSALAKSAEKKVTAVDIKMATSLIWANIATEADLAHLMPSIADYIALQQKYGLLSSEERIDIENFIVKQGVKLTDKLPKPQVVKQKISWGRYSITPQDDGTLKTQSGDVIRINKNLGYAKAFKKLYSTFTGKTVSVNRLSLFFPVAHASELSQAANAMNEASSQALNAVGGAISTAVGWVAESVSAVALTGMAAVTSAVCAPFVMPLSALKFKLKKFIFDGTVECDKYGDFTYLKYPGYFSTVGQDYVDGWGIFDKLKAIPMAHMAGTCLGPLRDFMEYKHSTRNTERAAINILDMIDGKNTIQQLFGNSPVRCDNKKALILEKHLKEEAKKLEASIYLENKIKKPDANSTTPEDASVNQ